jgi:ABC-type sugar transport system ATPase subunit
VGAGGAFDLTIDNGLRDKIRAVTHAEQMRFGIRAEDIQISAKNVPGDVGGVVSVREPLGDEIIYNVRVGEQELRVKAPPTLRFSVGENVNLKFDRARTHVYDLDTEQAIQ